MVEDIFLLKKKQRALFIKKRKNLKDQISLDNNFYIKKLFANDWFKQSKVIASFLSIYSEISTSNLNELIENEGKILCLPVINLKNKNGLIFKKYSKGDDLINGKFNIKEPKNNKIYLPDIIFTPCLCFDLNGFRLGYGGGYYDKTISYFNSIGHNFITIGLAYDEQKVDKVICDSFDQKLNYILTEKQLYKTL